MHKLLFGGIAASAVGLAACGGTTYTPAAAPPGQAAAPARAPAPVSHPAPATTTPVVHNPIPQGGGGDGDGDNRGGRSDGDGNV